MTITGGFGVSIDLETGAARAWYMGPDGVQRWADTDEPVERGDERPTGDTPPGRCA